MVFMIFQTLSRRFVGFNNACIFCLGSIRSASSFFVLAKHCCSVWISNLFRAFLTVSLNSTSLSSMKQIPRNLLALSSFGFSIAHLFFFSLPCFWHVFLYVWPQEVRPGCRLFLRQPRPPTMFTHLEFFFVQYGESCEPSPRIWHVSISFNVPIIVYAVFKQYIQGRICCIGHIDVS